MHRHLLPACGVSRRLPQRRRHALNNPSNIFGPPCRIVRAFADHGLCRVGKPDVNPRRTTARKLDAVLPKHFGCRINETNRRNARRGVRPPCGGGIRNLQP